MSDKAIPVGTAAAIAAVVGACSLCVFGPALFAALAVAASAWSVGLVAAGAVGLALVAVFVARWRCSAGRKHDNGSAGKVSSKIDAVNAS